MAETDGSYSHGFSTGRWAGRIAGLRAAARKLRWLASEAGETAYLLLMVARWCEREARKLEKEARRA